MELNLEYSVLLCEAKGQAFILLSLDKQGSDKRQLGGGSRKAMGATKLQLKQPN